MSTEEKPNSAESIEDQISQIGNSSIDIVESIKTLQDLLVKNLREYEKVGVLHEATSALERMVYNSDQTPDRETIRGLLNLSDTLLSAHDGSDTLGVAMTNDHHTIPQVLDDLGTYATKAVNEGYLTISTNKMHFTAAAIDKNMVSRGVSWPDDYKNGGNVSFTSSQPLAKQTTAYSVSVTIPPATLSVRGTNTAAADAPITKLFVMTFDVATSKAMFPVRNKKENELRSSVVSINVSSIESGATLQEPISIRFTVETTAVNSHLTVLPGVLTHVEVPVCVFWDFSINTTVSQDSNVVGGWNSAGCSVVHTSRIEQGEVICSCNHMTHFGVMFVSKDTEGSLSHLQEHEPVLRIITITGVMCSTLFLVVTLVVYFKYLDDLLNLVSTKILLHLVVSLIISQLLFVVGVDASIHSTAASCTVFAVVLQYWLLVSWAWMCVEAYHLYERFVVVIRPTDRIWKFALFAYGTPALLVAISAGAFSSDYGNDTTCWITESSPAVWFFVIPVILSLVFNATLLTAALRAVTKEVRQKRTAVIATATFMSTLGLNNAFGALILFHGSIVWHYCLAFSTILQGFSIFYFHCWRKFKAQRRRNACKSSTGKQLGFTSSRLQQQQTGQNSAGTAGDKDSSGYHSGNTANTTTGASYLEFDESSNSHSGMYDEMPHDGNSSYSGNYPSLAVCPTRRQKIQLPTISTEDNDTGHTTQGGLSSRLPTELQGIEEDLLENNVAAYMDLKINNNQMMASSQNSTSFLTARMSSGTSHHTQRTLRHEDESNSSLMHLVHMDNVQALDDEYGVYDNINGCDLKKCLNIADIRGKNSPSAQSPGTYAGSLLRVGRCLWIQFEWVTCKYEPACVQS